MEDSPKENRELSAILSEDLIGVEQELTDDLFEIRNPFDPDKIKVTTERKNIDLIIRRIDHGEVDLAPEFQRRARVWHPHRKSQLIESLLLRIPLPVFYVSANQNDDWAVVDGLQRITTIYDFIKGNFKLKGMEYLKQLDGKEYFDLDRAMRRRIEETELVINVIQPGTPDEVMINIFKRINTGGIPLTGQEIRNALNKGPVREFLRSLAESKEFADATDGRVRDERMDAQEMILRFLAFEMTSWTDYKSNDLDSFLNDAMRKLNQMTVQERSRLTVKFKRAMNAAVQIFDQDAFRKPRFSGEGRNPVSKPLFESWSVNLAAQSEMSLRVLVKAKDRVRAQFMAIMQSEPDFVIAVSYSTGVPQRVKKRFNRIRSLIDDVVIDEVLG